MTNLRYMKAFRIAVAVTATTLLILAGPLGAGESFASGPPTAPAWEPDTIGSPAPYGNITFYNSSGQVITGGNNIGDLFAYAVGDTPFNSHSGRKATSASIAFATPNHTGNTSSWNVGAFTTGTTFPLSSGPANLTDDTTTPVYTSDGIGGAGSNLTSFLGSSTNDPTAGYSHLVQIRLADSGLGTGTSSLPDYWEADIAYNTGTSAASVVVNSTTGYSVNVPAGSWVQVFPFLTSTTSTLTSTLTDPDQSSGTSIPLKATVSPAESGTVQFYDGLTALGSPVTLSGGMADFTDSRPPGQGGHSYTATFLPTVGEEGNADTATATIVVGSTSAALAFTIRAAATATTTTLSPTTGSVVGQQVTYTAAVSPAPDGGTVAFKDGGTTITGCGAASVSTTTGVAMCTATYTSTAGSPHTITAVYSGDTNYETSTTASSVTQTVGQASTSTAVTSSLNPSAVGQQVAYTATISVSAPGFGTPTGTVDFKDGGSSITCTGGSQTVAAGTATCSVIYLSTGSHTITATYSGDTNFVGSTTASSLSQSVVGAQTATVVTSSTNPSVTGQSITYTATVSPATDDGGTVAFKDGANTIIGCGSESLTLSKATCTTSPATAGPHTISAVYTGDSNFATSTSANFTQTVNKASTTVGVTSVTNPSVTGQPVAFTATVSVSSPGSGTPTGTVAFKDGGSTITGCSSEALSGVTATCTDNSLSTATSHTITAVYSGDVNHLQSTPGSLSQVVDKASTNTALTSATNPSIVGESVTFKATITADSPGSGTPGGTVAFKDGTTTICSADALTGGVATCADTSLSTANSHSITAIYSGNANYLTSTSPPLSQVVNQSNTATQLTSSANPSVVNAIVTYTATVTPVSPGKGTPGGTLTFSDAGPTICAAVPLTAGKATCNATYSAVGTHHITAVYSGDDNFSTSTSTLLTQNVQAVVPPGAPTNLKTAPGNKQVTLTWTAPVSNGGSAITGYDVYKGTTAGGESEVPVNSSLVTGATYTVTGLTNGTKYYFVVEAVNVAGNSGVSNEVSAMPVSAPGYWIAEAGGSVHHFGTAAALGSPVAGVRLAQPVVGMVSTPTVGGYWLVASDGGLFTAGNAGFHGSLGNVHLAAPIVGMAATPDGGGYWMVGADGGVFSFGNAGFHGSLGNVHLAAPVVGIVATPDGGGYWLVAKDGGVFAFGTARFYGSLGSVALSSPIVGLASTANGGGYWLVAADGSVYHFGNAAALNSIAGAHLARPIVAIVATPDGGGFWLIGGDGGVFNEGDAVYHGSVPGLGLSVSDVVDGSAAASS